MLDETFLVGDKNKSIFEIRNHIIENIKMKNSLSTIKNRPNNSKNSLFKESTFIPLKKIYSPMTITSKIKSPMSGLNLTNINHNPSMSIDRSKNINLPISSYLNNSSINSFINKTQIENENFFKGHQYFKSSFLQFKKRTKFNQSVLIKKENRKFGEKLDKINSPLNLDKLNESYFKLKEYRNLVKKVEKKYDIDPTRLNYITKNLPPLIITRDKESSISLNNFNSFNNLNNNSMSVISKNSNHYAKSFNFNYRKIDNLIKD
jgi:hypothetical protein